MGKLGRMRKSARKCSDRHYRESRDIDHAIAETKKALGSFAKRSEPDGDAGDALRREVRSGHSDEAAARPAARKRQRPGNLFDIAQVQERGKKYAEAEQSARESRANGAGALR